MGGAPANPVSGAQLALAFPRSSGGHQQQAHRQVRGAFGQHVRRVGHGDALGAGCVHVDVVNANAEVGDDAGAPAHRQHLRGEVVGNRGAECVRLIQGGAQFVCGEGVIVGVETNLKGIGQPRLHRGWPAAGDNGQRLRHGVGQNPSSGLGGAFSGGLEGASRPPKRNGRRQEDGAGDEGQRPTRRRADQAGSKPAC